MPQRLPFRCRTPYVDRLAATPVLTDVPRHLLPVLARTLEEVTLAAGQRATWRPGDVLLVADGHGVLTNGDVPVVAVSGGAIVNPSVLVRPVTRIVLVATSRLSGWIVPRPDLATVCHLAPQIDRALAAASPAVVPLRPPAISAEDRAFVRR